MTFGGYYTLNTCTCNFTIFSVVISLINNFEYKINYITYKNLRAGFSDSDFGGLPRDKEESHGMDSARWWIPSVMHVF